MGGEIPPIFIMGLFGSKKTYVSSTIYNMAGDIKERPNFLKNLITTNIVAGTSTSIAESIQQGYIKGPGLRIKSFARWAVDNYGTVGVPKGNLYTAKNISTTAVGSQIPSDSDQEAFVQQVNVGIADYSYWAEQWMFANYPDQIGTTWTSDINEGTNEITINLVDGTSVSFMPTDFNRNALYIYAPYSLVQEQEPGETITGETKTLTEGQNYPSTNGWDTISSVSRTDNFLLDKVTTTTATYSDNRPPETNTVSTPKSASYDYYRAQYRRSDYKGSASGSQDALISLVQNMYFFRDGAVYEETSSSTNTEDIGGGVTKTTVTNTTEQKLAVTRTYRIDKQEIANRSWTPTKLFIYRVGSGNTALDNLVKDSGDDGDYFPFIPLRLDNKFLSSAYLASAYEQATLAYKKATSGKLDDIIENLSENESLKDIDYAYIMFGVSLNTKENAGRKYIYLFFQKLMQSQGSNPAEYAAWVARQTANSDTNAAWNEWRLAQDDPANPLYGTDEPIISSTSVMPTTEVRISGTGTVPTNVDMRLTWQSIQQISGTGLRKPDAKKGDYWLEYIDRDRFATSTYNNGVVRPTDDINVDRLAIHWQVDENNWKTLNVVGLVHRNYIYKGKYVEINPEDALKDLEESGFLVPLHYSTFDELGMVDATQLSTACCYMVINSYLVKKTGFFQSGFFKILLVVAVVAITVASGGAGAASAGLLGTNAAVGASLGLSGLAAVIAGAVANAIVAMVVVKLVTVGSVAVFGDKLGAIIGTIAGLIAVQVGTSFANGGSLSSSIANLARAENLINITSAVGNGFAGYIQANVQDIIKETQEIQTQYEEDLRKLDEAYAANFGYGRAEIDPLSITNAPALFGEPRSTYLDRTLMTGSDIAELSQRLLTNFAEITLSTELP